MRKTKSIFLFVLSSFIALSLSACSKAKSNANTIKIAYLPITHALPILKEAKDLENKSGLKVELVKYGSWPELLDALNSNRVDGASVLIELAMKSKQEGVGIKAVALGHRDGNVIVVSNKINNGSDLKGKTFAIPHRQSSHNILLNDALKKNGLSIDDVKVTELSPTEMPSALASGQIDGYCVAEPFGAMGVALKAGKVLYSSEELWENSLCCSLVLTDKYINEHKKDVSNFVKNYKNAGASLNKKEAKKIAKEYLKQSDKVLDISLKWITYDNLTITEDIYNDLVNKVKEYNLSDNPPSFSEFVNNDL